MTTLTEAPAIDPITLEVIRYGLISTTNQIDANIKRTAFSPYIYEYNDFAVGMTDIDGRLIAQCTGGMPPSSSVESVRENCATWYFSQILPKIGIFSRD